MILGFYIFLLMKFMAALENKDILQKKKEKSNEQVLGEDPLNQVEDRAALTDRNSVVMEKLGIEIFNNPLLIVLHNLKVEPQDGAYRLGNGHPPGEGDWGLITVVPRVAVRIGTDLIHQGV